VSGTPQHLLRPTLFVTKGPDRGVLAALDGLCMHMHVAIRIIKVNSPHRLSIELGVFRFDMSALSCSPDIKLPVSLLSVAAYSSLIPDHILHQVLQYFVRDEVPTSR
jgi:hypothetical protein